MTRLPRSSKADIVERETRQAKIIAELTLMGADDIAARVTRCWSDRLVGDPGRHRYRCRSVACLSCRRPPLEAWFRSFRTWAKDGGATSYLPLPIDDPIGKLSSISKSLRNLRDSLSREESWLWSGVAFLGVADESHCHIVVSHPGIERSHVEQRLRRLWQGLSLSDMPIRPIAQLDGSMLARLAARRRGLQPLRFQVLPATG